MGTDILRKTKEINKTEQVEILCNMIKFLNDNLPTKKMEEMSVRAVKANEDWVKMGKKFPNITEEVDQCDKVVNNKNKTKNNSVNNKSIKDKN